LALAGHHYAVGLAYTVNIDNGEIVASGQVDEQGEIFVTMALPPDLQPGPHVLRVCVDCRVGGIQQETFIAFLVADPVSTPSPTPAP
jgi:hypothetical protein